MKHTCLNCSLEFDLPEGEPPRCPGCMRVHGIEPVATPAPARKTRRPVIVSALVVAIVGGGAATGWYFLRGSGAPPKGSSGAAGSGAPLLEDGPAVAAIAADATGENDEAKAQAMLAAVKKLLDHQRTILDPQALPERREPTGGDGALGRLKRGDPGTSEMYSLEVSAGLLLAARRAGLDAIGVELPPEPPPRTAGSPKPVLPRIGVAVYPGKNRAATPAVLLLSGGGHERAQPRSDKQLEALALAMGAAHALYKKDGAQANEKSAAAMRDGEAEPGGKASHSLLVTRGAVLIEYGQFDEAERMLRRALEIAEGHPLYATYLAAILLRSQKNEEALKLLTQAKDAKPSLLAAKMLYGVSLLAQLEVDKAQEALAALVKEDPGFAEGHKALALAHTAAGRFDDAKSAALKAIETDPGVKGARMLLAEIAMQKGDMDEAQKQIREEQKLDPSNPQLLLALGKVLLRDGKKAEALQIFGEAAARSQEPQLVKRLVDEILKSEGEEDDTSDGGKAAIPAPAGAPGDGGAPGPAVDAKEEDEGDGGVDDESSFQLRLGGGRPGKKGGRLNLEPAP